MQMNDYYIFTFDQEQVLFDTDAPPEIIYKAIKWANGICRDPDYEDKSGTTPDWDELFTEYLVNNNYQYNEHHCNFITPENEE